MNPLSPMYFIRENKSRCFLLMLMLFLSYGIYLGGLYVTNPFDNFEAAIAISEKAISVTVPLTDNNAENEETLAAFETGISESGKAEFIKLGSKNNFSWESIMGFTCTTYTYTFLSVDDFRTFCRHVNIDCDFDSLKNGSLIMSERFARNRGLAIGDRIDKDYAEAVYDEYTLDAVTSEDGYTLYFINENAENPGNYLLLGKGISSEELFHYVYSIQDEYDLVLPKSGRADAESQFKSFNVIYQLIVIMLSVILSVTINAAFVGLYQRRNYEFAVYRAIGISKRRIIGKITEELLLMDAVTLAVGGAVCFTALYLFNNLVLYPAGKYLRYYHPLALFGLLLCNVLVVVPLIITRCRQLLKADICEY